MYKGTVHPSEMSSEQELDYYNEEAMYDVTVNGSDISYMREQHHSGVNAVLQHVAMFALYPTSLVTSLMLLVTFFRNKKIHCEPWRWLIAHANLCIFMIAFFLFMQGLTYIYLLPSLDTSPLCPAFKFLEQQIWAMINVSLALVIAERFAAMRKDNWKEGGMAKRDVLITLAVFWLASIVLGIINISLYGVRSYSMNRYGIKYMCSMAWGLVIAIPHSISFFWLVITAIVGMIASIVYACKKPDQDKKRDLIFPTLAICISLILFFFSNRFIHIGMYLSLCSVTINSIVFSLTWLIVWTRNGDIQWLDLICCPGRKNEEIQLIETNKNGE